MAGGPPGNGVDPGAKDHTQLRIARQRPLEGLRLGCRWPAPIRDDLVKEIYLYVHFLPILACERGPQGQAIKAVQFIVGEGNGIGSIAPLPAPSGTIVVDEVDAHGSVLSHLVPAGDLDAPILGALKSRWNCKAYFLVGCCHALCQGVQGLLSRQGLCPGRQSIRLGLGPVEGHQDAQEHRGAQAQAGQQGARLFYGKKIHDPSFHLSRPSAEGHGPSGACRSPGGPFQQHPAVAVSEGGILPRHHVIVTAQLQVPSRPADHPPHQRIEPVDGVD